MGVSLRRVSHLITEDILPVDHTCGSTKYFFHETLEEVAERISHSSGKFTSDWLTGHQSLNIKILPEERADKFIDIEEVIA